MKVRLSRNIAGDHDIAALKLAREAAEAVNLPLMAHIGDTASPLPAILKELRPGDVITYSFHGRANGILDSQGRILAEVRKSVESGVRLDAGHGRGSFARRVMEAAMKQESIRAPFRAICTSSMSLARYSIWLRRFPSSSIWVCHWSK